MEKKNNIKDFSAEQFVDNLISQGSQVACDETNPSFNRPGLPDFYDEELFKKAQQFFNRHVFGLFASKFFGLMSLLTVPTILKVLQMTKNSSSNLSAYRRYLGTVFHMLVWYRSDFKPGSRLWESIESVKSRHNSASKKCPSSRLHRISQMDMALTQFGFMGFAITRGTNLGIFNVSEEEWKAFIHLWRVIGYLMGIEDRFNICRESVAETREICNELIRKVFYVEMLKRNKDFLEMSAYLCDGMWCMEPMLQTNVMLTILYEQLQPVDKINENNNNGNRNNTKGNQHYMKLTWVQRFYLYFLYFTFYTLKFNIFRVYHNYIKFISFWLMEHFPFLAYREFGKANSHVYIFPDKKIK